MSNFISDNDTSYFDKYITPDEAIDELRRLAYIALNHTKNSANLENVKSFYEGMYTAYLQALQVLYCVEKKRGEEGE